MINNNAIEDNKEAKDLGIRSLRSKKFASGNKSTEHKKPKIKGAKMVCPKIAK